MGTLYAVLTKVTSSRVTTARVVVLARDALESGRLVNRDRARRVLVLHVRILDRRA